MNKLEKINNIVFAVIFGIIAIAETYGTIIGRSWCLGAAICSGFLSLVLFREAFCKQKKQAK